MMRFYWPISNLTFSWSAENKYKQFISIIFAYSIFQENWKMELAEPCTDQSSRQHCVAMSLCPLTRNQFWKSSGVNNGYWKSVVFKFVSVNKTIILMQSELPTLLNAFQTDYELQYSESYTASRDKNKHK